MKPLSKVNIAWSPYFAYAIGLLVADGSLSKDGRHIDFTSGDLVQVENFKKCLALDNKIGVKSSGLTDKKYFRIQFGDRVFYDWLLDIGLAPNKSKIISELKIPDDIFFDFLRGYFDGDGYVYGFRDARWKNSYMYYVGLTSGSKDFLVWMQDRIFRLCGAIGVLENYNARSYQLKYAKAESRILFAKMFYRKELIYLERKYEKFANLLNSDPNYKKN